MPEFTDEEGVVHVLGGDDASVLAAVAAVKARSANRSGLAAFIDNFEGTIDALLANHWDFLDAYSDRFFPGQNGQVGTEWPQFPADPDPTTLAQAISWVNRKVGVLDDREQIIRSQLAFVTYAQTREARLFRLILALWGELIERDPTLTPPPNR